MSMVRRFSSDERGAVTIEFVAIVPFFMLFFAFFVDTCMIYFTYVDMYAVARDASRRYSTDQFESTNEVRDYVAERLVGHAVRYHVTIPDDIQREVIVTANIFDTALFGAVLYSFVGENFRARASALREPIW